MNRLVFPILAVCLLSCSESPDPSNVAIDLIGPPQDPFFCATEEHRSSIGLGEVLDEDCAMDRVVSYVYKSKADGEFKPIDESASSDMSKTTTMDGKEVDFIVRWERGTINRFIYSTAVLTGEVVEEEEIVASAWSGKLIYYFQGGVGVGHYQGKPDRGRMLYEHGLSKGYAVVYSTGTRASVHYNLALGGQTAIMVKNRFVESIGEPFYTVGVGASGGAIQQYVYAQNHPGLIDAAIPQYSYPDMVTQGIHIVDCELLERFMDAEVAKDPSSKWAIWSNRSRLQGLNASDTIPNPFQGDAPGLSECINGWRGLSALTLNPHYGTAPGISEEEQKKTVWTHGEDLKHIYGMAEDGFAGRTFDNTGVQYGLKALNDDFISPTEFLDLNARIGSWKNEADMVQEGAPFIEGEDLDVHSARNMHLSPDDDGAIPALRGMADPGAIENIESSGLVFQGDIDIPIIDWRHYLERELDMHNSRQSFVTRKRMLNHDGEASNHIIWSTDTIIGEERFDQTPQAFEVIDEWMENSLAKPSLSLKENRPEGAIDSCFDEKGVLLYSGDDAWNYNMGDEAENEMSLCDTRFPIFETSRTVAGWPFTEDLFKCELQSLNDAIANGIYIDWTPNSEERDKLDAIFPDGVCRF